MLKAAAHIIIAASAKGARPNQRISGVFITSDIVFIDIANYRVRESL